MGGINGAIIERDLLIPANKTVGKFELFLESSGSISATYPGVESAVSEIELVEDKITLHFDIAPRIVKEGEEIHYFAWFEKNGQPYRPEGVITGYITTSDNRIVNAKASLQHQQSAKNNETILDKKDQLHTINLINGFSKGTFHGLNAGQAVVTLTIPDYNTVDVEVLVGSALYDSCIDSDDLRQGQSTIQLTSWIIPPITSDTAYLVIAKYDAKIDLVLNPDFFTDEDGNERDLTELSDQAYDSVYETTGSRADARNIKTAVFNAQYTIADVDRAVEAWNATIERGDDRTLARTNFYDALQNPPDDAENDLFIEECVITPEPFLEPINIITTGTDPIKTDIKSKYNHIIELSRPIGTHEITLSVNNLNPVTLSEAAVLEGEVNDLSETRTIISYEVVDTTIQYEINWHELPFPANMDAPIGLVYLSENGTYQSSNTIEGNAPRLLIIGDEVIYDDDYSELILLRGNISESTVITISADGVLPISETLEPHDTDKTVKLELPPRQHLGEEFPYVAHLISGGEPILRQDDPELYTGGFLTVLDNNRMVGQGTNDGKDIRLLTKIGHSSTTVRIFENILFFSADLEKDDKPVELISVGEEAILKLEGSDIDSIEFSVTSSNFEITQISNTEYIIKPDSIGSGEITIIGKKPGYESEIKTLKLSADQTIEISINAVVTNNPDYRLASPLEMDFTFMDLPKTAPFRERIDAATLGTIEFPAVIIKENSSHLFNYTVLEYEFNDPDLADLYGGDAIINNDPSMVIPTIPATITVVYTQDVFVEIIDAEGSGVYSLGDLATISPVEKEIIPFLLYDKFDYWEGDLSGSGFQRITVTDDIYAKAYYKPDYTNLMAIISIAIAALLFVKFGLRNERLMYMLRR